MVENVIMSLRLRIFYIRETILVTIKLNNKYVR